MKRLLRIITITTALALATPALAHAEFLPGAELISLSPERQEQGDANTEVVDISADGRYVVFQTRARNLFPADHQDPPGQFRRGGLFRRDLDSGELELVALGDLVGDLFRNGAKNPSISADGRYVSFSSADPLVPEDANTRLDVYVRDMSQAIDSAAAFELASVRDGSSQPATYGGFGVTGAQVTVDSSLSADGRKVVFGTQTLSDLPAADAPTTPAGQLFVRDLDANTTTLVTRNMLDGTPAGGAASAGLATISADGSTVAWAGQNGTLQTRMQPGELSGNTYYFWRRVADGPAATTRRITGAVDVDDPGCLPGDQWISDESLVGPCYGPLGLPEDTPQGSASGEVPSLSADGRQVAFLAAPSVRGLPAGNQFDAFLTDMTTGLTRKAATTELTRELQSAVTGAIRPVKISADGRRIAFVSNRQDFGIPGIRLLTPPPATEKPELYVLHVDRREIERVTLAWDGGEIDRPVANSLGSVAMSADGRRLAFVATATNLFKGDANEADDAFVAREGGAGGGASGPAEPPFDDFSPREDTDQRAGPVLPVSVRHGSGGTVRVTVRTPAAGTLTLTARARVKSSARTRLRPIAKGRTRVRKPGRVTLVLKPAQRYRRLVRRERRVRSRLEVRFAPSAGGPSLVARRTVSFTP